MNTDRLSISVVIPTYNRAVLVRRAVLSALAAMKPGDEIIVVDDGSTDNTENVLAQFTDRIRYVRGRHEGAGPARNLGVTEARNDLIAFLDSDDEWFSDKLEVQRNVMRARPEIAFCFSDFSVQDDSGQTFPRYLKNWHNDPRPWDQILGPGFKYSSIAVLPAGREDFSVYVGDIYPELMARPYIGTFTLIFRRDLPGGVPAFPGDLPTFEDWEFFGELAKRGLAAYFDCETAIQHGHRMPRLTHASGLVQTKARIKLLERVWGADPEYIAHHGSAYKGVIDNQRRLHALYTAVDHLKAGRMREARIGFSRIGTYPAVYRFLKYLPGPVLRAMVKIASKIR